MARGPIPWRGATECCRRNAVRRQAAFGGAVQQDGLSGFECGDFRGEFAVFNGSNEKFECRSFRRRGNGITADNWRCAGFKFHSETGELPGAETVVSGTFKFKDKERGSCLAAAQKLDGLHIGKAFGPGMGIDGSSECAFRTKGFTLSSRT